MKRTISQSVILLVVALSMPLLLMRFNVAASDSAEEEASTNLRLASESTDAEASTDSEMDVSVDRSLEFTALLDGQVSPQTIYDYLPGAVAGEMPASFEPEALRAQAIAARTYILYRTMSESPKHPEAAVCDDPACCKLYMSEEELRERWGEKFEIYWEKICAAVRETDGQCLTYEDKPIQAVFHSSSAGVTEFSGNLWSPLPYLVSVSSPETAEDVPNFVTSVELSADDFERTIRADHPDAVLDGASDAWIGDSEYFDSGRVDFVVIGGVKITGAEFRQMFDLRSTSFELKHTEAGSFIFTVTGYGHGVGLSQYGANVMAKQGALYEDILEHYYPGTTLAVLRPNSQL